MHTTLHADKAGQGTPANEDAPVARGVGIQDSNREATHSRKTAATLQALAALAGIRVDPIESDDGSTAYVLSRWNLTRQCNTLDELRGLLRRMGVEA